MNGEDHNRKVLCDIANCAFDVVNGLITRDQLLASDLRSTTTGSRQIYREECITVEMASTLRERFPEHVTIILFTPPEEKRTGGDWYWRFERGNRAIHAYVQAKRVQRAEFGQPDDEGEVEIDYSQLTKLLDATKRASKELTGLHAWLATYARYGKATPPCGNYDLMQCLRHRHQDVCTGHEPSLWIASAQEISNLNNRRLSVRQIIENSVRLDCILPCIDGAAANDGPAIKGFRLRDGLSIFEECVSTIERDSLLRAKLEGALRIAV